MIDISNSTCIANLLESRVPNCTEINNQHIPIIEEMSAGLLFLNQFDGPVQINNETTNLKGTFLIRHHNVTIKIEKRTFGSKEIPTDNPLPAVLQLEPTSNRTEKILSLEMMEEMNIKNIKYIDLLESKEHTKFAINFGFSTIIIILLCVTCFLKYKKGRNALINEPQSNKRDEQIQLSEETIKGLNEIFKKNLSTSNEDV